MNERDDLLVSVAKVISEYRKNDLAAPTPEHVDRWLHQFTPDQQLPFLREFEHVIKKTFCTQEHVKDFLRRLVSNRQLAGANPTEYWSSVSFLNIQQNGQSQKEMLKLFAICLKDECGLDFNYCGEDGGDFVYLDDVMFSGNRVGNDLEPWIVNNAPQSAKVHVIMAAFHTGGLHQVTQRLNKAIAQSGKNIDITYWRKFEIENRKWYKNSSQVLWPREIPDVAEVRDYTTLPMRFPFEPRQSSAAAIQPFSSEEGRQVLEREFLIAGAKIWAMSENPKQSMRPLGFSPFGVGFGSMIVTYRNCPNNSPLAMWWGDPEVNSGALHWYPLLQREGYSSARNVFSGITF
ncbi:MAG: hypothetical protein HRU05_11760 [Oceanospirillaceae bacterium]|nr:hypothetical protein [Oceanospirillaceae bacterium]